jgi:glycosyltransferase involved in cell wall biosynthesis
MGNQAVLAAQEYSWEKITSKLMNLYEEILRNTTSNQTGNLAPM